MCFFSGTDTQELHDNAPNHNYYVSLIVNYQDITAWTAKVAAVGKIKRTGTITMESTLKGKNGEQTQSNVEEINEDKECLYIIPCKLKLSPEAETFVKSVKAVQDLKKPVVNYNTYGSIQGYRSRATDWMEASNATVGKSISPSVGVTLAKSQIRSTKLDLAGRISHESFYDNVFSPAKVKPWLAEMLNDSSSLSYELFATVITKKTKLNGEQLAKELMKFEDNFEKVITTKVKTSTFIQQGVGLDQLSFSAIATAMVDILEPYKHLAIGKGLIDILDMYIMPDSVCDIEEIKRLTGIEDLFDNQMVMDLITKD